MDSHSKMDAEIAASRVERGLTGPVGVTPDGTSTLTGDHAFLTWADIAIALGKHSRLMAGVITVVGIATAALLLVVPKKYVGSVSLVPETRSAALPAQLAGLASLAGINTASASAQQSPQFYAAVLVSRPILYAVLERTFSTAGLPRAVTAKDSAQLVAILKAKGDSVPERLWNGARELLRLTDVRIDLKTGIIRVAVELRSPLLAASVANAFADELNRFNREGRQYQARTRRMFVEARLQEVSDDLTGAEHDVRTFLVNNREYDNSPRLRFEYNRLQRALTVQQDLYLDLRRQLDAARIAEADDLPAITTVERAIPPERRSAPRRLLSLTVVLVVAAVLVSVGAVILEYRAKLFPGGEAALEALRNSWGRRR